MAGIDQKHIDHQNRLRKNFYLNRRKREKDDLRLLQSDLATVLKDEKVIQKKIKKNQLLVKQRKIQLEELFKELGEVEGALVEARRSLRAFDNGHGGVHADITNRMKSRVSGLQRKNSEIEYIIKLKERQMRKDKARVKTLGQDLEKLAKFEKEVRMKIKELKHDLKEGDNDDGEPEDGGEEQLEQQTQTEGNWGTEEGGGDYQTPEIQNGQNDGEGGLGEDQEGDEITPNQDGETTFAGPSPDDQNQPSGDRSRVDDQNGPLDIAPRQADGSLDNTVQQILSMFKSTQDDREGTGGLNPGDSSSQGFTSQKNVHAEIAKRLSSLDEEERMRLLTDSITKQVMDQLRSTRAPEARRLDFEGMRRGEAGNGTGDGRGSAGVMRVRVSPPGDGEGNEEQYEESEPRRRQFREDGYDNDRLRREEGDYGQGDRDRRGVDYLDTSVQ